MQSDKRKSWCGATDTVQGTLRCTTDAEVLNLSLTGAAVTSTRRLDIGRCYNLVLDGDRSSLKLVGRVVRCTLSTIRRDAAGDASAVYEAGLEFEGVLGAKGEEMLAFLAGHTSLDPSSRVADRFFRSAGERIALDLEHDFVVRELSRSGMLIETDAAMEPGSECPVEVRLADRSFGARGRIAHVAHEPQTEGAFPVRMGVEFVGMEASDRSMLESLLSR